MDSSPTYIEPRLAPLRWIASIDPTLPPEVRKRLGAMFFSTRKPFVVGTINAVAVLFVAFYHICAPVFLIIAAVEVLLLMARLMALREPAVRTDQFLGVGLAWALTQAITIVLVVMSRNIPMTILVLASGFAAIGSIIGRNFAAPRYAMAQVLLIDFSFKASFGYLYPSFMPLIAVQSVMFVLMNVAMIEQQRGVTVRAITAEIDSRTQSTRDPLTDLLNRRGMEGAFEHLVSKGTRAGLLYLDLDGFKQVNDSLGHRAGDLLLQEVGHRLVDTIGADAVACRLGGDEFLILCGDSSAEALQNLGGRLIKAVSIPYEIEPAVLARIGVSVGATVGDSNADLTSMMAIADRALYAAKAAGKGRCILDGEGSTTDEVYQVHARCA